MEVSPTIAFLFATLVVVIMVSLAMVHLKNKKDAEKFCGGLDAHCKCDGNEKFVPRLLKKL